MSKLVCIFLSLFLLGVCVAADLPQVEFVRGAEATVRIGESDVIQLYPDETGELEYELENAPEFVKLRSHIEGEFNGVVYKDTVLQILGHTKEGVYTFNLIATNPEGLTSKKKVTVNVEGRVSEDLKKYIKFEDKGDEGVEFTYQRTFNNGGFTISQEPTIKKIDSHYEISFQIVQSGYGYFVTQALSTQSVSLNLPGQTGCFTYDVSVERLEKTIFDDEAILLKVDSLKGEHCPVVMAPPVLRPIGDQEIGMSEIRRLYLTAIDPNNNSIQYEFVDLPSFIRRGEQDPLQSEGVSIASQVLVIDASQASAREYAFKVIAIDSTGMEDFEIVQVKVSQKSQFEEWSQLHQEEGLNEEGYFERFCLAVDLKQTEKELNPLKVTQAENDKVAFEYSRRASLPEQIFQLRVSRDLENWTQALYGKDYYQRVTALPNGREQVALIFKSNELQSCFVKLDIKSLY